MNQLKFFQNALANSVEILLNTEVQVMSHLKWIIEQKRAAVEEMAIGKIFNYDDIGNPDNWEQKGIEPNVDMKVVIVDSECRGHDITGRLKNTRTNLFSNLFTISVVFLRDPRPLLKSKAKLTDKEANILKEMSAYYELKRNQPEGLELLSLNQDLKYLKHKYNMAFSYQWSYGFNDILDSDILKTGLRVGNVSITKSI